MPLLTVDCDEHSNFYAVADTGLLYFYRDEARNGNTAWAFGGAARQIGQGWQNIHQIICGGGGVIYAIDIDTAGNGRLLYFKDLARNGTQHWAGGVKVLGNEGWQNYTRVFSGGDGILYAIGTNGDLYFFRDEARDGSVRWSFGGVPQKIGSGWNEVRDVAYGGDGIIYAVTPDGRLLWFRDLGRNGTFSWAKGGRGQEIGEGWSAFARVLSGQDGVLYGITPDGAMQFFRDLARDGTVAWDVGAGQQIGSGWFVGWQNTNVAGYLQNTNVAGYAWPMSASAGERISFYVSARASYTVTYVRLKVTSSSIGVPVAPSFDGAATPQGTPPLPWQDGCGWSETFALDIPKDWIPGLYSAQCVEPSGATSHIVFTVKPSGQRADFAVLTCTNTLNAYNGWGGRSKYFPGNQSAATLSFLRPNPLSAPIDAAPPGQNGYGMPEFWTLNWMEDEGYNADVYTDADFESGIAGLESYRALILNNHPEYWTDTMLDTLEAYLAGGGSLLYLAGNGLFERCVIQDGGKSLLFYDGDPSRGRAAFYFRNATPPRPERAVLGVAFLYDNGNSAPYRVVNPAHRVFRGTGLRKDQPFGSTGRNGAASGWEMDSSDAGTKPDGVLVSAHVSSDRGAPPANIELLAVGTNTLDGVGAAHMVLYRHPGGGIVFSVGSLTFTGSLADDPTVQRIVANVLDECRNPSLGAGL